MGTECGDSKSSAAVWAVAPAAASAASSMQCVGAVCGDSQRRCHCQGMFGQLHACSRGAGTEQAKTTLPLVRLRRCVGQVVLWTVSVASTNRAGLVSYLHMAKHGKPRSSPMHPTHIFPHPSAHPHYPHTCSSDASTSSLPTWASTGNSDSTAPNAVSSSRYVRAPI